VDRTGPDHHEQPVVGTAQHIVDQAARMRDMGVNRLVGAQLAHDLHGGEQFAALLDAGVIGSGDSHLLAPLVCAIVQRPKQKTASRLAVSRLCCSSQRLPTALGVGKKKLKKKRTARIML
jgi:hypothetical protein